MRNLLFVLIICLLAATAYAAEDQICVGTDCRNIDNTRNDNRTIYQIDNRVIDSSRNTDNSINNTATGGAGGAGGAGGTGGAGGVATVGNVSGTATVGNVNGGSVGNIDNASTATTGDVTQTTGAVTQSTGDVHQIVSQETGDVVQEDGDVSQEVGPVTQETGDVVQEDGDVNINYPDPPVASPAMAIGGVCNSALSLTTKDTGVSIGTGDQLCRHLELIKVALVLNKTEEAEKLWEEALAMEKRGSWFRRCPLTGWITGLPIIGRLF